MYLTKFEFFKNTPFTDLKNTIYFKSNKERDDFFPKVYETIKHEDRFNFIKDRGTIRIRGNVDDYREVNYCRFKSDFEPDITYYCFIPEYKYINDEVIELNLMIDGFMTFCQNGILDELEGLTIEREHLSTGDYLKHLPYLKNNDDIISCYTKRYFHKEIKEFRHFNILIHSAVSLNSDFGTMDNPNIESSTGAYFDSLTSPIDLYLIEEKNFDYVMEKLKKFPWITQNFKKIVLIPKEIIDKDMKGIKLEKVNSPSTDLSDVYKIVGGGTDMNVDYLDDISKSEKELMNIFGLDYEQEKHLLRNTYTTIEMYNWSGGSLIIDTGQLPEIRGLELDKFSIGGYENELAIFPKYYKASNQENNIGSLLNDSMVFNTFDDIPILIDSYGLAMSKSAFQREYKESNLLSGKIDRILDSDNSLQDRLLTSVSVLSNISPSSLIGALSDEHEYYRQQKAQEKELRLEPNQVTESTVSNGLNKRNNNYGITVLYSKPDDVELDKIKNYYKLFGYEVNKSSSKLSYTRSMSICNYIQFKGNIFIKGIERSILETLKVQFENGLRLWHNKDIANPFIQDIRENKRIF